MNNFFRKILILCTVIGIVFLSGCGTKLFKSDPYLTPKLFEDQYYEERISSVLVSSDNKTIAIITDNHHYIFNNASEIISVLKDPIHPQIVALFKTVYVSDDNNVSVEYSLFLNKDSSEADKLKAMKIGFEDADSGALAMNRRLDGIRYSPGSITIPTETTKLNRTYTFHIRSEQNSSQKSAKLLLTPITVGVDGAIFIGMLPLAVIVNIVLGGWHD